MTPLPVLIALLAALLHRFPNTPARACLESRHDRIVAQIGEGETQYGVPPGLLLSVGFFESHDGCDPSSGGCWGAPRDFQHRHIAGTHLDAARVLRNGFVECGDWIGAVSWFRSGVCATPNHADYVRNVLRLARVLYAATPDSPAWVSALDEAHLPHWERRNGGE